MDDDISCEIAQLRHAHMQLMAHAVLDQPTFADGLLSPVIVSLEKHNQKLLNAKRSK